MLALLASFASDFWPGLVANLAADALIVTGAFFLIERRLQLGERQARQEEFLQHQAARREELEREQDRRHEHALEQERAKRWEVAQNVLRSIGEELDHNAQQAARLMEHLPKRELPFPAFDVNGWHLIVQTSVVTAIQQRTLVRLVRVYNRFRTANEVYAVASDLFLGPSSILAVTAITNIADADVRRGEQEKFEAHRQIMLNRLLERVTELMPHLEEARELVHEERAAAPEGALP